MLILIEDIESLIRKDFIFSSIIVVSFFFRDKKGLVIKNVFMGCSRSEFIGEFEFF